MTIAFVTNWEVRSARQSVLAGVMQAARDEGHTVAIFSGLTAAAYNELTDLRLNECHGFNPEDYNGLILSYPNRRLVEFALRLHKASYPVVSIARPGDVPFIACDNTIPIRDSVIGLAQAGHKDIAFLAGPSGNASADLRLQGYVDGLQMAGIPMRPEFIIPGEFTECAGHAAVLGAWKENRKFSALVAGNDASGIGALLALRELGVEVPQQVEVIGFDDLTPAKWATPSLSTFALPEFDMGYASVLHLTRPLSHEQTFPVVFVRRESLKTTTMIPYARQTTSRSWRLPRPEAEKALAVLRKTPESATLLRRLEHLSCESAEFEADFQVLIRVCERLDVNVASLDQVLRDKTLHAGSTPDTISDLLVTALCENERKHTEVASEFDVVVSPLRQLTLEATDEKTVIATFVQILRTLGVARAALYLRNHAKDGQLSPDHVCVWTTEDSGSLRGDNRDPLHCQVAAFLSARPGAAVFVGALVYRDESRGVACLQIDSQYWTMFSELLRQFTVALQGARMNTLIEAAHKNLVDASHYAGMAEVAAGVLHNVGNVLNSLNVSAILIMEELQRTKIDNLRKLVGLLSPQSGNLRAFLESDEKGKKIVAYLDSLATSLAQSRSQLLEEAQAVRKHVEHIKDIVTLQQSYATTVRVIEVIDAKSLMEDALRVNSAALVRHDVRVLRECEDGLLVNVEKAKALQILVNLISNAKYACDKRGPEKQITVRVSGGSDFVLFAVEDNGIGIPEENMAKIFNHGFTTRSDGHGFGLHSAVLTARALNGTLTAHSDGQNKGARFVLKLPMAKSERRPFIAGEGRGSA